MKKAVGSLMLMLVLSFSEGWAGNRFRAYDGEGVELELSECHIIPRTTW